MGVDKFLKELWFNIKTVAVEPEESPVMSGGEPGLHGIQGIGDGSKFLVDLNKVDEVRVVSTECAKACARHLAKKYGLFVGISAAANVFTTFQWLRDNCEAIGATYKKKYLGTILFMLYTVIFVMVINILLPEPKQPKEGIPHNYWVPTKIDKNI